MEKTMDLPTETNQSTPIGFADEDQISADALPYIRTVIANGCIKLYGDYTFRPKEAVLREEAADIFGALIDGAISAGKSESFSDFKEISTHFEANAKKIVDYSIMIGYPDGTFRPKQNLTREELALILFRITQKDNLIQRKP